MAYCQHCRGEIHRDAEVCIHCGRTIQYRHHNSTLSSIKDEGGFLWGLLGFLVPVAGLVIYLIWKDERPNNAKAAGLGALVNVGIGVAIFIIYIIFFIGLIIATGGGDIV